MDIKIWNKETKQAYVGTLLYSLLGIITAIITPFARFGDTAIALASLSGESLSSGFYVGSVLLSIIKIGIIFGYVIFFLAIKDLRSITRGEEQHAFKRIYLSIIFDIIAALLGIFHLGFICGIMGLVSCILLISAYSTLKSSHEISQFSTSAISGFSLLFTAEILILVAICLGWIPIISIIASILKAVAWFLVLFGWKKVAHAVAIPGEELLEEKPLLDSFKEVIVESVDEAKYVAKDMAEKTKIVAEEVRAKTKEATDSIKMKIQDTGGATIQPESEDHTDNPEKQSE